MVGSGTLLIEAASWARGRVPGIDRAFAFERAPWFARERLSSLREELKAAQRDGEVGMFFFGNDRDAGAIEATKGNAARAGVLGELTLSCTPISQAPLPTRSDIDVVCNLPYGERVGDRDGLQNLYASFGQRIRELPGSGRVGVLVTDRKLAAAIGLKLRSEFMTDHGGLKVYAMVGRY